MGPGGLPLRRVKGEEAAGGAIGGFQGGRPPRPARQPAIVAPVDRVEVAVVGSGLLGSATAWALGERGVPALLLEQFTPGHARGSSHGATRIFRLSHPEPDYVRMAVLAGEAWARLARQAGEDLVITTGGLDTGPAAEQCAVALQECGWSTPGSAPARSAAGSRGSRCGPASACCSSRTPACAWRIARSRRCSGWRSGPVSRSGHSPRCSASSREVTGSCWVPRRVRSPRGWPSSRPAPGPRACWPGPWPTFPG